MFPSLVTRIKPPIWNVSPMLTAAPDLWRGVRLAVPLWEKQSDAVAELVQGAQGTATSLAGHWASSAEGPALEAFDTNARISFTNEQPYRVGSSFTVIARIETAAVATDTQDAVVHKGVWGSGTNDNYVIFALDSGGTETIEFRFEESDNTKHTVSASHSAAGNVETIAATYDGATLLLYRDGVEIDSLATSAAPTNNTADVNIGHWGGTPTNGTPYNGKIFYVIVADRPWSADELKQLADDPYVMFRPADDYAAWQAAAAPAGTPLFNLALTGAGL